MASHITGVSIVYSTVWSSVDQRKHQSSASLAFVRGIHLWPVNFPQKGPVTQKMFPFNDVIMCCHCERMNPSTSSNQAGCRHHHISLANAVQWLEGGVYLARCDSHSIIVDIWDTAVFTDGVTRLITMLIRERPCSCQNTLSGLILPVSAFVRALQPPSLYQMR